MEKHNADEITSFDKETFKETIDLIPTILKTSKNSFQREMDAKLHNLERKDSERSRFQTALSFIEGKWTVDVLYMIFLMENPGYNQLLQALPGLNSRTLTDRLKLLEEKLIVNRTAHDTHPVRVTYTMSDFGLGLIYLLLPALLYLGWPELISKK